MAGGTFSITGANIALSAATALASGAQVILSDAKGLGSSVIANEGTFAIQDANGDFNNTVSGAESFNITNSNITLAGTKTHNGRMTVSQSIVTVSAGDKLGAATGRITLDNSTLKLDAAFDLAATRTVSLTNTATVDTNGYTTIIEGDISSTRNLEKQGDGGLTLLGDKTYSGYTIINAGELKVNGGYRAISCYSQ